MRLDDDINDVAPPKRSKDDTPKSQKSNPHLSEASRQSAEGSPIFQVREVSPSKILMRFDAPSPNGSTDSRVIVLESKHNQPEAGCSGISKTSALKRIDCDDNRSGRNNSQNKHQSGNQSTYHNNNQNNHLNDSQNTHQNDSQNSNLLSDSQNGQQNDIQNRQHSDTRHQLDNNMSNNRLRYRGVSQNNHQRNSHNNINISKRNSHDSDSSGSELLSEGRTRRPRKDVVYKEKPLNSKLRR